MPTAHRRLRAATQLLSSATAASLLFEEGRRSSYPAGVVVLRHNGKALGGEVASELTKIVNAEVVRLIGIISPEFARLGFAATKKRLWVRAGGNVVPFLLLERRGSTYGGPTSASVHLEMKSGLRVLNSAFPALGLNGPMSEQNRRSDGLSFHTRFNARSGSQFERTCEDLVRFAVESFVPWATHWSEKALLSGEGSPLTVEDREALQAAVSGGADPALVAQSRQLLGLWDMPAKPQDPGADSRDPSDDC